MIGVYLRVSTEDQAERGTIATQREFAESFIDLHKLGPVRWFVDEGISGTIPLGERPSGSEVLQEAAAGRLKTLLVYKLDRLGRSPRVILNAVHDLEEAGCAIQSMTEPFDTSSGAGRFMVSVLGAVAGLERDTLMERSRAGMDRLARAGCWLGGIVPYGYRTVGDKANRRLVVSDDPIPGLDYSEADVVRMIYAWSAEDRLSCKAIADGLNTLGIPTHYATAERGKRGRRTAGIWRAGRVRNMIVNPTYKGTHLWGTRSKGEREPIPRECPPVVTPEQWAAAQSVLRSNLLFSMRNAKRQYLLRGLMKCDMCGLTFIGTGHTPYADGSPRHYYVCDGRHNRRGLYSVMDSKCPSAMLIGRAVDDAIWSDIYGFLTDPDNVLRHMSAQLEKAAENREKGERQRVRWEKALARTHQSRARAQDLAIRGLMTPEELSTQLDEISAEQEAINAELTKLGAAAVAADKSQDYVRDAEELLASLKSRLSRPLPIEVQRQIVEALVKSIVVETYRDAQNRKRPRVRVTYAFSTNVATGVCTGSREEPTCNITHVLRIPKRRKPT